LPSLSLAVAPSSSPATVLWLTGARKAHLCPGLRTVGSFPSAAYTYSGCFYPPSIKESLIFTDFLLGTSSFLCTMKNMYNDWIVSLLSFAKKDVVITYTFHTIIF
jgi:hypothetical protein